MSEDQDLLERIGRLAGHINLHKSQQPSEEAVHDSRDSQQWRSPRSAPYSRARGRAGRIAPVTRRNRTLIMNNTAKETQIAKQPVENSIVPNTELTRSNDHVGTEPLHSASSWISKHDRHRQLINSSVFDRETQTRKKAIEDTQRQKALQRDQREKFKIDRHLRVLATHAGRSSATPSATAIQTLHKISINGLEFHVDRGGSKLSRILGASDTARSTPKKANVGGVTFLRSKNGNLYRHGVVKAKKEIGKTKKISEPCKRFTITGHCPKGPLCPYTHNPDNVAMCKDYLQTGDCIAGDSCDLSHDPTPERVPACLHFLRGKCSNVSCRYAHVRVNPSAPVCRDFAVFGYCGKGASCNERHVHECPDYANNGACHNKQCRLPHVDRAGQIRKQAANLVDDSSKGRNGSMEEDDDSDVLSEEDHYDEIDSDDVESDGLEDDFMQLSDDVPHQALSQQQDFVQF